MINQNTLIVDRYKYLDLFPSTQSELKSMGYKDSTKMSANERFAANQQPFLVSKLPRDQSALAQLLEENGSIMQSDPVQSALNESKKAKYPLPDTMQMLPYKPIRNGREFIYSD